jgi:holin-like protein
MDFIKSAAWLVAFWALGEGISRALKLPVPGSVIGLLLLYFSLRVSWVRSEWVAPGARGLLGVLGLLFVPTGAGVVAYSGLPWPQTVVILALLAGGIIGACGWLMQKRVKP